MKVLFVCGRNQKRSPTAARLYQGDPRLNVRSAGTSDSSRRRVSEDDLRWADLIVVMERKYTARIRAKFPDLDLPRVESLEIPDDYEYMDPELIDLLRDGVEQILAASPRD